jgi:hypothetical protein
MSGNKEGKGKFPVMGIMFVDVWPVLDGSRIVLHTEPNKCISVSILKVLLHITVLQRKERLVSLKQFQNKYTRTNTKPHKASLLDGNFFFFLASRPPWFSLSLPFFRVS